MLQAIKDLPILCKDQHIKNLPKIVDVLVQLLQSEDGTEVTIIQNSIMTLIRRDTRAAIIGIFNQVSFFMKLIFLGKYFFFYLQPGAHRGRGGEGEGH